MGASLLALANEIYMLLKDANILPLQFSYYESIAKLMLDIGNKTAAANIPELRTAWEFDVVLSRERVKT